MVFVSSRLELCGRRVIHLGRDFRGPIWVLTVERPGRAALYPLVHPR